ncbi:unnamed protein product [Prorocentrum cordatum]|uniref:Uncharacterized protein n=1 Tax=Prorocentrum cordatum TaxID=2364126 RepID=A0ABN9Q8Z6_9DINO|nr:unnamed protein product [Polarella glacialis]
MAKASVKVFPTALAIHVYRFDGGAGGMLVCLGSRSQLEAVVKYAVTAVGGRVAEATAKFKTDSFGAPLYTVDAALHVLSPLGIVIPTSAHGIDRQAASAFTSPAASSMAVPFVHDAGDSLVAAACRLIPMMRS